MKHLFARLVAATLLAVALFPALAATAFVSTGGPGGSVSHFNASGGAALSSFSTPPGTTALLLSNDGTKLFVGTTSSRQGDIQGGAPSIAAVLDAETGAVLHQVALPGSVAQMVKNAAEDHLYASGTLADGTVVVMSVDLASGGTASTAVPGAKAFNIYTIGITPDGARLFVPVTDSIVVFDSASLANLGSVPLPGNGIVAPPLVTPDGSTLLTVGNGTVHAIDTVTLTVTKSLTITTSAAAFGAALSADGLSYYVNAGTITKVDLPSFTTKLTANLGQTNPFRMGLAADDGTLFATDLTFATTLVIDAGTLAVKQTLHHIAPPWAVAVRADGNLLVLNENSNAVARIDSSTRTLLGSFPVGDAPGAGVFAAGRLFVPEVSNVAVQEKPSAPTAVKPIETKFVIADSAAAVGNKVYANSGSQLKVINPQLERVTRTMQVRVPSGGGIGSALAIAAAGDNSSLLASYVVFGFGGAPVEGGLVKIDTLLGKQKPLSSKLFLPWLVCGDRSGAFAYATGYFAPSQVGRWDVANNRFDKSATVPGNPDYSALAVSADAGTLLLADAAHGKIDFLNAATLQLQGSLAVGPNPSGIAVSPDGSQAAVTDGTSNTVIFVDLATRTVQGSVSVGAPSLGVVFQN
jgi:DNA-binding beta-propeller fold protein YncE